MTPQARVAAAISLLESVEASEYPADRVAAKYLRGRRYIGAKDRRAILNHVYGAIRRREALDWWIARAGNIAISPRTRAIASLALAGDAAQDISGLFSGGTYGPAPLAPEERELVAALSGMPLHPDDQPLRVKANCPEWIAPFLERRFRDRFLEEMEALNEEAPLDLRVNTLMTSRADALGALREQRIEARPTPFSPWGIRLASRQPIAGLDLYREGLVEIQDEGSQIVSLLTDAQPGQTAVDFCSGGGGKSLALAAAMKNRGEIAALDVSPRLSRAAPRLKRAGARIVTPHRLTPGDPWLAGHAGQADRVLVDAPCTGVGAWRRDPMARFRLTRAELERLTALQRRILADAAGLVKPGGRIIYATCSPLCEENEDQAAWFAANRSGFKIVPIADIWTQTLGGACPADGPYLLLTPKRHGTDGFFVAAFECVGLTG